jgi:hypothetical protein
MKENPAGNSPEKNVRNFDDMINLNRSMVRNEMMQFRLVLLKAEGYSQLLRRRPNR